MLYLLQLPQEKSWSWWILIPLGKWPLPAQHLLRWGVAWGPRIGGWVAWRKVRHWRYSRAVFSLTHQVTTLPFPAQQVTNGSQCFIHSRELPAPYLLVEPKFIAALNHPQCLHNASAPAHRHFSAPSTGSQSVYFPQDKYTHWAKAAIGSYGPKMFIGAINKM